jgi:protein-disulfide isomerase
MASSKSRAKKRSSSLSAIFIPVAFFAGLAAGYLLWGNSKVSSSLNPVSRDDPAQGPENAPVTIVEFSDYQCPYCKLWHDEVLSRLLVDYAGQIRFIYRDYPLSGHPEAQSAAEAANCAGDQDAYWEFHEALFGEQYGYGRSAYEQYARDLGLDVEAFTTCLDSNRYQDEVLNDFRDGIRLGVSSTPTFFINGTQVVGAQPYEVFKQLIDAELALENE